MIWQVDIHDTDALGFAFFSLDSPECFQETALKKGRLNFSALTCSPLGLFPCVPPHFTVPATVPRWVRAQPRSPHILLEIPAPFPCLLLSPQPATSASSPSARTCARRSTPCVGTLTSWRAPCLPSCPPSTWPHGSPSPTPGSAPTPSMEKRSKWVNAAASRICTAGDGCTDRPAEIIQAQVQGAHN